MKKFKLFLDIDNEEQWLNDMLHDGHLLKRKFFYYEFINTERRNGIIKTDFRNFKNNPAFIDYKQMFEDSGWEHIEGTRTSGTQYFIKFNTEQEEDIFSDTESKLKRYERYTKWWLSYLLIMFIIMYPSSISKYGFNPKNFYLTPGLWEKTGEVFWSAFWFETPFVIMRSILPLMFLMGCFFFVYFSYRSIKQRLLSQ